MILSVFQNEIYIQIAYCLEWRRARRKKETFENDDRAYRGRSLISDDSHAGGFIAWHLEMACVGEDYARLCTCHVLTHAVRRIVNPRLALSSYARGMLSSFSEISSKWSRECDTRCLQLPGRETTYVTPSWITASRTEVVVSIMRNVYVKFAASEFHERDFRKHCVRVRR